MKRLAVVLIAFALIAVACGDDDSGGSIIPAGDERGQRVELTEAVDGGTLSAIDTAIGDLGPDGAVDAVVFSLDDGYDADQITAAMAAGSLAADGSIDGVDPSGPAFNVIDRSGPSAYGDLTVLAAGEALSLAQGGVDVGEFKRDILSEASNLFLGADLTDPEADELTRSNARAVLGTLLILSRVGYTLDQTVTNIVLGNRIALGGGPDGCLVIEDGGRAIAPERTPGIRPESPCGQYYESLRAGDTAVTTEAPDSTDATDAPPATTGDAGGDFTFRAVLSDDTGGGFFWDGSFSIVGDQLVGSGTLTGGTDGACSIEDGPEHPFAYDVGGTFDMTGTLGEATMSIVLAPTGGAVTPIAGDQSELCVDLAFDIAEALVEFPLGSTSDGGQAMTVPRGGGSTNLDLGDGFVFEVDVTTN